MVNRTIALFVATIALSLHAAACSDPAEELCDQPQGGGTDDVGDDGIGVDLEHADELVYQTTVTSAALPGSAALTYKTGLSPLEAGTAGVPFRYWIEDPRGPVTDEDELQSYPLRTVVSIAISRESPDGGITTTRGTGFLAGPRHVVTNRHVVQVHEVDINKWIDDPPMFFRFEVFPGRSKLAILNGGAWTVERVIWNPFPETHYNDYAILILEDDIERSGRYGRLGLCSASNSTLDNLLVTTAGYPSSTYKCGQTPDPPNEDGNDCPCGGWMYTQSCEISEVGPQELIHTCLTQNGQSGSPLWVDECTSSTVRCTVGVHYGKSGLSSAAVRWQDEDIEWLHSNICQWTSDYAPMPPFCN